MVAMVRRLAAGPARSAAGLWVMRFWLAVLCGACPLLAVPAAAMADSARFEIVAQPMPAALKTFAQQAQMQLLYEYGAVANMTGNAISGDLEKRVALEALLRNTGLEAVYVSDYAATIRRTGAGPEEKTGSKEDGKTASREFRVAQATAGQAGGIPAVSGTNTTPKTPEQLSEIVVTAEKREERLQDVPVPVTALEAAVLTDQGQVRLQDYYSSVPGLTLTTGDEQGFSQIAIRGLTTGGFSTPTVGVVVDDVPLGSTVGVWSFEAPDLDPSDLARVEVLRGPQGTLYGANSMGGLLKYVTISPSTDEASARVQVGTTRVYNTNKLGSFARASGNLPLGDAVAVRASVFDRYDAGYIDNVRNGERGVNSEEVTGGRVALLWRPADSWSVNLAALSQHGRVDGSPDIDVRPGLGDLQQDRIPGTGWRENTVEVFSAKVEARILNADITSITAHSVNKLSDVYDFTQTYGSAMETLTHMDGIGAAIRVSDRTSKFTQELRVSVPIGNRVKWLVGGYYGRETEGWYEPVVALDPTAGALVLNAGAYSGAGPAGPEVEKFSERAVFSNVTVDLTDRLDVQLGGRQSYNNRLGGGIEAAGLIAPLFFFPSPDPYIRPDQRTTDHPTTYLVTPRFRFSQDLMVYARLASGYRPGGPSLLGTPVKPDTTENYEIGAKGTLLDHTLSFDASLYYIDWKDIPFEVREPVSNLLGQQNAARARSDGFELSTQWHPVPGLKISGWASWNDAEITHVTPGSTLMINVGDRLPLSSRFSGNLSINQAFTLPKMLNGFVEGVVSYVGDRKSVFTSDGIRQDFPQYTTLGLRAGIERDLWEVNLFANNITDKRGVLAGGLGTLNPQAFYYIQPRTVGVSLTGRF